MSVFQTTLGGEAMNDAGFELGIVRLSRERKVLYMNRAAVAMVDGAFAVGSDLSKIALAADSRKQLDSSLDERFAHRSGNTYAISIPGKDAGVSTLIQINAVPEFDAAGELTGSIGFIVDKTIDQARANIHQVIMQSRDCKSLMDGITAEIRKVISFHSIYVTGISNHRRHLQSFYQDPPLGFSVSPTKWWPMKPFMRDIIDNFKPGPHHLEALLYSPPFEEYAKSDPEVQYFRDQGFTHDMRFPIILGGCLIATVSLMRKEGREFTASEFKRVNQLPIAEIIKAAMNFEERRALEFGFSFVHGIAQVADDSCAIAQKLVDQLAEQYGWEHVSLFRLNKEQTHLDMVCQAGECQRPFPEGYSQAVTVGLIGKAFRENKVINVGDVKNSEDSSSYHQLVEGMVSELVHPVPGTSGRWLLNIESKFRDAFADEEQKAVEAQLRVAGFILERMAALEQQSAIVSSVNDAVFQTNGLDVIVEANKAAEELLGYTREELTRHSLAHFVAPDSEAWSEAEESDLANPWMESPTDVCRAERGVETLQRVLDSPIPLPVHLQKKDHSSIPVLLSAAELKTRLGGRVFVASDLRRQQQLQRLEAVTKVYHQLASELRVPLSLADFDLREAVEQAAEPVRSLIDGARRQLRKTDVPLERLMRLAVRDDEAPLEPTVFNLNDAIATVVNEMPFSERDTISLNSRDPRVLVRAPRHELLFCVRSLLSYLIRRRAVVEKVRVSVRRRGDRGLVSLELPSAEAPQIVVDPMADTGTYQVSDDDMNRELELELAEPVVKQLMQRMGGSYLSAGEERRRFRLSFTAGEDR